MTQLDPASPVNVLADRFWEAILAEEPTTATMYGDDRYDDRLEDPSPEGRARRRRLMETTLADARAIDPAGQSLEDRITLDMIRVVCELAIVQDDQRIDLLRVVDQMIGPQTLLPQAVLLQSADTPERLERLEARLRAYEGYMAANRDLLKEGLATGLTAPRIVAERTIAQLERLLEIPADESIITTAAQVASEADRARIERIVRDVVLPADRAFLEAIRDGYLAGSREEPGLWSAPDGDALY
ncbi:MAG: DUF885 domain-containing protein, partial [Chloroflexota bacterium]|nr:DUF885 domain-containing protein [Chloroflexota bacterium]